MAKKTKASSKSRQAASAKKKTVKPAAKAKPIAKKIAAVKAKSVAKKKASAKMPDKKSNVKKSAATAKKQIAKKKVVLTKATKAAKAPKKAKPAAHKRGKTADKPANTTQITSVTLKKRPAPLFPIKGATAPILKHPQTATPSSARRSKLSAKFLATQQKKLFELRDHVLDQMHDVAQESLRSANSDAPASAFGMHQADAGSDAYEKDFALSLLSQEQDALYEIAEALRRITGGTYGICEMSGELIPQARLEAIPFARYTVKHQSQFERENKGRNRWDTAPQFMESTDNFYEEEDDNSDDEDRPKIKE